LPRISPRSAKARILAGFHLVRAAEDFPHVQDGRGAVGLLALVTENCGAKRYGGRQEGKRVWIVSGENDVKTEGKRANDQSPPKPSPSAMA